MKTITLDASLCTLGLGIIVVLTLTTVTYSRSGNGPPLPPGPPADPFLGHLLRLPDKDQEVVFHEWAKLYGDVIHLQVFGRHIIVLDTPEAAIELLEKRSANYSSRPRFVVFESMGWLPSLTFLPYGKTFKKHRRFLQQHLNLKESLQHKPQQLHEARMLLKRLLAEPEEFDQALGRFSASIVIWIAYGYRPTSNEDRILDLLASAADGINKSGSPGNTPVDMFPILKCMPSWFPGTHYAEWARRCKPTVKEFYEYPFDYVKKQLAGGTAQPSFVASHIEALENDDPGEIMDIKGAAATMCIAGYDSTWSTLSIFVLIMVRHPDIQRKAQSEIDRIIGSERLLDFGDRERLPYIEHVFQEMLRWKPVVALGIPHRSMEDDVYKGMFIPKGSIIFPNTGGMCLDERVYHDPTKFNPDRYFPQPRGNNEPHPNGPFGFGRRICPGQYVADASIWVAFASILAGFDILKAVGEDGKEITPEVKLSNGLARHPEPFRCVFRPRSEGMRNLIVQAEGWAQP